MRKTKIGSIESGNTPLREAANNRNMEELNPLVADRTVDINATNADENTTPHLEVIRIIIRPVELGNTPLHDAANNHNTGELTQLVADALDINATNINKNTPLHLAVFCHNPILAEMLIKANANVDAQNNNGNTPAHLSKFSVDLHPEIFIMLLGANVNITIENNNGKSVRDMMKNPGTPAEERMQKMYNEFITNLQPPVGEFLEGNQGGTDLSGDSASNSDSDMEG